MRVRPRRARRPSHAASEVVKAAVAEAKSRAVGVDRADCGNVRFIVLPEVTTDDDSVFLDGVFNSDDGGDAEPQVMAPATTRGARNDSIPKSPEHYVRMTETVPHTHTHLSAASSAASSVCCEKS